MRFATQALAAAALAAALVAPTAYGRDDMDAQLFVKMSDTNKDGMVSKAEMMKMVEKMFDKHDTKKRGMLDKEQAEAFLKELMKGGGA